LETQINIDSTQAIINLLINKKKGCINVAEIFLLQNYIKEKKDETIHMNIRYDDVKRSVKYNEELFFMTGYRILLREDQTDSIKKMSEKKISKIVEEYVKNTEEPMLFPI